MIIKSQQRRAKQKRKEKKNHKVREDKRRNVPTTREAGNQKKKLFVYSRALRVSKICMYRSRTEAGYFLLLSIP